MYLYFISIKLYIVYFTKVKLYISHRFGSVSHNFIWSSFNFFKVPETITDLVKAYFQDLLLILITTGHLLEIGQVVKCIISSLAFTMSIEVILWLVRGKRLNSGDRLPPIRAYKDYMTTITTSVPCILSLLLKPQEKITRMKIKSGKSRSMFIVRGKKK